MRVSHICDNPPPYVHADDSVLVLTAGQDIGAKHHYRGRVLLLAPDSPGAMLHGENLTGCRFGGHASRLGYEGHRDEVFIHFHWDLRGSDLRGADLRGIGPGTLDDFVKSGCKLEGALTGPPGLVYGRPKDPNAAPVLITYQGDSNGGVISWDPSAPGAQGIKWSAVGGHPIAGGCCWGSALAEGAGILWRKKEVHHYRQDQAPGTSFVSTHYEAWAMPAQLAAMVEGDELSRRLHKYAQVDFQLVIRPRIIAEVRDALRLQGVTFA